MPTRAELEISVEDSRVVEIYDFSVGAVTIDQSTSADDAHTVDGDVYAPRPGGMKRGLLGFTATDWRNAMRIIVGRSHPVAIYMRQRPRTGVINVTCRAFERGAPDDIVPVFGGRVLNMRRVRDDNRELLCESRAITLKRIGLRSICRPNCGVVLYGSKCRLNPDDWKTSTTIDTVVGNTLNVAAVDPAQSYPGGMARFIGADGIVEYAFIVSATDTALLLDLPFYGAGPGDAVDIWPGCDHTIARCASLGNDENFDGRKDLPSKNAFVTNVFL